MYFVWINKHTDTHVNPTDLDTCLSQGLQNSWSDMWLSCFLYRGCLSKMEVKTSLLDNMIGVGDMVLIEPLSEDTFIENLKKRFDHNEIYVSNA